MKRDYELEILNQMQKESKQNQNNINDSKKNKFIGEKIFFILFFALIIAMTYASIQGNGYGIITCIGLIIALFGAIMTLSLEKTKKIIPLIMTIFGIGIAGVTQYLSLGNEITFINKDYIPLIFVFLFPIFGLMCAIGEIKELISLSKNCTNCIPATVKDYKIEYVKDYSSKISSKSKYITAIYDFETQDGHKMVDLPYIKKPHIGDMVDIYVNSDYSSYYTKQSRLTSIVSIIIIGVVFVIVGGIASYFAMQHLFN